MASYRDRLEEQQRLATLADLEDAYVKARDEYREKDTPARREKFKAAKQEFSQAQQAFRRDEETAGRRTPGVAVAGGER